MSTTAVESSHTLAASDIVTGLTLPVEASKPEVTAVSADLSVPDASPAPAASTALAVTTVKHRGSNTVTASSTAGLRKFPKEIIDKSLVLEMALFLYISDHHQYPALLEELNDGHHDYLHAAATLRGISLADARLAAPNGYRWFYDRTSTGDQYLLGLTPKEEPTASIDAKLPIVCSLQQEHSSLLLPGPEATRTILRYRERKIEEVAR